MSHHSVDYDAIASTYNQRFDKADRPATARALEKLAHRSGAHRILEVGCGTGRWLAALAVFTEHCHGLDLSSGMLAQAHSRDANIHLTRGRVCPSLGLRYVPRFPLITLFRARFRTRT